MDQEQWRDMASEEASKFTGTENEIKKMLDLLVDSTDELSPVAEAIAAKPPDQRTAADTCIIFALAHCQQELRRRFINLVLPPQFKPVTIWQPIDTD